MVFRAVRREGRECREQGQGRLGRQGRRLVGGPRGSRPVPPWPASPGPAPARPALGCPRLLSAASAAGEERPGNAPPPVGAGGEQREGELRHYPAATAQRRVRPALQPALPQFAYSAIIAPHSLAARRLLALACCGRSLDCGHFSRIMTKPRNDVWKLGVVIWSCQKPGFCFLSF